MKGKVTNWTRKQLREDILNTMNYVDCSGDEYSPKDIVKDFEELCCNISEDKLRVVEKILISTSNNVLDIAKPFGVSDKVRSYAEEQASIGMINIRKIMGVEK